MAKFDRPVTPLYQPSKAFQIQDVPVSQLMVDREKYQRFTYEQFVQFIVDNFDPALLGHLVAARRPDGSIWVIDGQQRLAALRRIGWTHAPCRIIENPTVQQEADYFYKLDTWRKKLNAMDLFRARVTAEDPQALKVLGIINEAGWQVDLNSATWWTSKPDFIRAVDACETALKRYGDHTLRVGLTVLKEAWPGKVDASHRQLILGVTRLHFAFNDVVRVERLIEKLSGVTPKYVLGEARDLRSAHASRIDEAVAEAMWTVYRKNLRQAGLPKFSDRRVLFTAGGTRLIEMKPGPELERKEPETQPEPETVSAS